MLICILLLLDPQHTEQYIFWLSPYSKMCLCLVICWYVCFCLYVPYTVWQSMAFQSFHIAKLFLCSSYAVLSSIFTLVLLPCSSTIIESYQFFLFFIFFFQAFLEFRCSVVERRARYKLSQAQDRRHIVEVCLQNRLL